MLRVFEAFAGVGSQRMALRNIGVEHEVVAISEIDGYALASYEFIHGDRPNLGDISNLTIDQIPDHDLFTYSFPCQDISNAGRMRGLSEGSGTRSSLLWECKRVIEGKKPRYLLLENVKNLVGKKNRPDFDKWLDWLEEQGYTNYWKVVNAKHHGIPQNRERVFVVSILGEHKPFVFPEDRPLEILLKDILEPEVDERYYLPEEIVSRFIYKPEGENVIGDLRHYNYDQLNRVYDTETIAPTLSTMQGGGQEPEILININRGEIKVREDGIFTCLDANYFKGLDNHAARTGVLIRNATKLGYLEAEDGDGIDLAFPESETRRGRVQKGLSQTLTTSDNLGVLEGFRIRKLTPLECWRLMGFSDEDFQKAAKVCSNSQLYKQAGNSIVVNVLEDIFTNLFKGGK